MKLTPALSVLSLLFLSAAAVTGDNRTRCLIAVSLILGVWSGMRISDEHMKEMGEK